MTTQISLLILTLFNVVTITSIAIWIAIIVSSLTKYPIMGTLLCNIRRGAALTKLWHSKHITQSNCFKRFHAFIIFRMHLLLTYMLVQYAFRYVDDGSIAQKIRKHI